MGKETRWKKGNPPCNKIHICGRITEKIPAGERRGLLHSRRGTKKRPLIGGYSNFFALFSYFLHSLFSLALNPQKIGFSLSFAQLTDLVNRAKVTFSMHPSFHQSSQFSLSLTYAYMNRVFH